MEIPDILKNHFIRPFDPTFAFLGMPLRYGNSMGYFLKYQAFDDKQGGVVLISEFKVEGSLEDLVEKGVAIVDENNVYCLPLSMENMEKQ